LSAVDGLSTGDGWGWRARRCPPHAGRVLDDLPDHQDGVVTRTQALAAGISPAAIRAHLAAGRWQRVHEAVYVTFSGPLPRRSHLWAAVLRAGYGAMVSHQTAAELAGLCEPTNPLHVTVPSHRRVGRWPGVVVHYSCRAGAIRHPGRIPPQTRIEETVVDLTQSAASIDRAVGWLTKACGSRLTTPPRLLDALEQRKKLRWRAELTSALTEVADGCHSVLETRYLRHVERAHRLPRGRRQVGRQTLAGRRYDDVRYDGYGVVVELDGRVAHPDEARWRDMSRDNAAVVTGDRVLRYGWGDVTSRPCEVATQVATALHAAGWPGPPVPCTPACPLALPVIL
jgi:very-short-patch-repair endonuclease